MTFAEWWAKQCGDSEALSLKTREHIASEAWDAAASEMAALHAENETLRNGVDSLNPDKVLAEMHEVLTRAERAEAERDQLKAENERIKDSARALKVQCDDLFNQRNEKMNMLRELEVERDQLREVLNQKES